ncbi:MXAN_5187 C-terminal domain-containing protein [Anaeromyxobacter paludicola]|uniref:Uncharacterized protein n=1 Tax=Anaeromyxobacter paludicola TaxID=2918171 RepID=A0ABM7XD41_9BACT|nr:MXAN_5187 C-terminal domain-containing protein [Anaeromyxobacter paludicola]BDG09735.1 hypothetical protein AMPC_28480 [Anaeromyxobacter paludicola]
MTRPPNGPPGGPGAPGDRARDQSAGEALSDECDQVERDMDELRARYELYFLGVERVEPVRDRAVLKQQVNRLLTAFTRNAGLRFRVQALHARFISYERLWMRNSREREEGTYRRDLYKARRRAGRDPAGGSRPARAGAPAPAAPGSDAAPESAVAPAGAAEPGPPAALTAAATGSPRPAPPAPPIRPPGMAPPALARPPPGAGEDPRVRALYDAYVDAKRRCNEDVSRITYDAVARTVAQQTPQLRERLKAKDIDFKVVIQDGRAVLKAVPKG